MWCCQGPLGPGEWDRAGSVDGQAENEVGGGGAGLGTEATIDIEAEPDETSNAAQTDLFGTQSGGVTGGNASHFGEVVHRSEFYVAGPCELAHQFELTCDALASGNAGLSPAIENFFDGVEGGMVDAFPEREIKSVGRRRIVQRQHLKGFHDGKRNVARRLDAGGIKGRGDGTSPLQREGGGNFLFRGKPEFLDPLTDLSVKTQRRGPEDARGRTPDLATLGKWKT